MDLTEFWKRKIRTILNAAAEGVELGWFVCRRRGDNCDLRVVTDDDNPPQAPVSDLPGNSE